VSDDSNPQRLERIESLTKFPGLPTDFEKPPNASLCLVYPNLEYRREWIVMVRPEEAPGSGVLFAVDCDQNILAADRHARGILTGNSALDAIAHGVRMNLWTLFEKDLALFRSKDRRDIPAQLIPTGTAETWSALITPPDNDLTPWQELDASLHTRPRLGEMGCIRQLTGAPVARGGLSPNVLRRVREYIDANLEANIGLEAMSKVAGLSRCHFVRAFRQSVGPIAQSTRKSALVDTRTGEISARRERA
jgi:hypothetical protein